VLELEAALLVELIVLEVELVPAGKALILVAPAGVGAVNALEIRRKELRALEESVSWIEITVLVVISEYVEIVELDWAMGETVQYQER
jgi:hypothetical protein